MLADRRYCYPLTISDLASRYLIGCEALATAQQVHAFTVFERVLKRAFKEFGVPHAIRTDNGVPFWFAEPSTSENQLEPPGNALLSRRGQQISILDKKPG